MNEEKNEKLEALSAAVMEKDVVISKLREEEEARKSKFLIVKSKFDEELKQANNRIEQLEQQVIAFCVILCHSVSFIQ